MHFFRRFVLCENSLLIALHLFNKSPQPRFATDNCPQKFKKQPKVGGVAARFRVKSKAKKANTQKNKTGEAAEKKEK